MRKIHLGPEMGELSDGSDPAMSIGVATERPGGTAVELSGLAHPDGTAREQAATVFGIVEDIFANDLDGSLDDVTRMRFYVREDRLTPAVQGELHEVRREFFEGPAYPAATMVGVASLVHEDAVVEVEVEGFVPDEEWTVETVHPDE